MAQSVMKWRRSLLFYFALANCFAFIFIWRFRANNPHFNFSILQPSSSYFTAPPDFSLNILPNKNYSLAVYIRSSPNTAYAIHRQSIRESWMIDAKLAGLRPVFIFGSPSNAEESAALESEMKQHGDLLIFNDFIDHYHNLSLKTRDLLRWHTEHRPMKDRDLLLWINTDVVLFVQHLLEFIETDKSVFDGLPKIYGSCTCDGKCMDTSPPGFVKRNKKHKFYLSWEVEPNPKFPHFCSGHAILMLGDTAERLYKQAQMRSDSFLQDYFIDDALYTGVFRKEANIPLASRHRRFPGFGYGDINAKRCRNNARQCVVAHLHDMNTEQRKQYWMEMKTLDQNATK